MCGGMGEGWWWGEAVASALKPRAEGWAEVRGELAEGILPLSLRHYGKHDSPSNLLCSTKERLFEIPGSVIKGAIELQNTIITARLGVALAH